MAAALQIAVLWGLGALLVLLIRPRTHLVEVAACAPVVALGTLYVVRSAWDLIGLGGPFPLPIALVALAAIAAAVVRKPWRSLRLTGVSAASLVVPLAVLCACLAVGAWLFGTIDHPPGWDAMNHAFITRRASEVSSLNPHDICVTGLVDGKSACEYYPLGLNNLWASAFWLGVPLRSSMLATIIVTAPLALACGMMALQRRFGFTSGLASLTAFIAVALGPLWLINLTGRITAAAGIALIPSAALALLMAVTARWQWTSAVVAALALVGVAGAHTNDMLVAVALGGIGAFTMSKNVRADLRPTVARLAGIGALCVVLMSPILHLALRAAPERSVSHVEVSGRQFDVELRRWLFDGPEMTVGLGESPAWGVAGAALMVLAPLGVVAAVWYRPVRAWAILFLGVVGIGLIALLSESSVLRLVTRPWYGDPGRIAWPLLLIRPALAAGAVGGALQLARRAPRVAPRQVQPKWAFRSVSVVALAVMLATATDDFRHNRWVVEQFAPFTEEQSAADEFLLDVVPDGAMVLDDRHHDGGTWSYADHGVPVLFGLYPLSDESLLDYNARLDLLRRVGSGDTGETTQELLERYRVTHVLTRSTALIVDGGIPLISPELLDANPMLERVFESPGASVYAVRNGGPFPNDKRIGHQTLTAGATLTSSNGDYTATLTEAGELVIADRNGSPTWSSLESRTMPASPNAMLYLARDGDLWLVAENTELLWRSQTEGHPGTILLLEPNGQLVLKAPDGAVLWTANPPEGSTGPETTPAP